MSWKDGRLTFPQTLSFEGEPLALAAADLDGGGRADLVVALRAGKTVRLLVQWGEAGSDDAQNLTVPLEGTTDVADIRVLDADGDGRQDVLVLASFAKPRLFVGREARKLEEASADKLYRATTLDDVKTVALSAADLDGDGRVELLLAQDNYARRMNVTEGAFAVVDQINGPDDARVLATAACDVDGDGVPEVVLLDSAGKKLRVMKRDDSGIYRAGESIRIDGLRAVGLAVADMTGDGRDDVVAFGRSRFVVVPTTTERFELSEGGPYESKARKASLALVTSCDLPGAEAVVVDVRNRSVEFLHRADAAWKRRLHWKVFQHKSFEDDTPGYSEPRDLLVTDVTGDGRPDLILLVHDRVVVYPHR